MAKKAKSVKDAVEAYEERVVEVAKPVASEPVKKATPKRQPNSWASFCSTYFQEHCKGKQTYKSMLEGDAVKTAWAEHKAKLAK